MMNIFKTAPRFLQLQRQLNIYNSHAPEFLAARDSGDAEGERELIRKYVKEFACSLVEKWKLDFEIVGKENLPDKGPILAVSNHQSACDVLALFYAFDKFQMGFIAKSEWTKWKALATAIGYTRSLFITRGDKRDALKTLQDATDLLKAGFSLTIFPEGTRSRGGEMAEFKPGSFKFAEKAKVPVLPVTVDGGWHLLEEKNSYQPCRVRITFHPLVHYEDMTRAEQKEAQAEIYETIKSALIPGGPDQSGL